MCQCYCVMCWCYCVIDVDVVVGCMLLLWDVCWCCCVMYVDVAVWHMLMLLCDLCCCCMMYVDVAVWCMLMLLCDLCCCCMMYVDVAVWCMLMLLCGTCWCCCVCDVLMLQGNNVATAGTDSHRLIEMARDRALPFLPDLHQREQFVQHLKLQSITQYVSSVCLWLCVHAGFVWVVGVWLHVCVCVCELWNIEGLSSIMFDHPRVGMWSYACLGGLHQW